MEGVKDRIISFARKNYNMGMTNFEKYTGIASGTISNMKEGINTTTVAKIMAKCPDLDANWLITGELRNGDATQAQGFDEQWYRDQISGMQRTIDFLMKKLGNE